MRVATDNWRARTVMLGGVAAILVGCAATAASPTPAVAPSAARAAPVAIGDFPLGKWCMTVTEADLKAGGITDPSLVAENAGTACTTYSPDGIWRFVQECTNCEQPIWSGTFTVNGNGLDKVITFPTSFAGEQELHTWKLENDTLVLEVRGTPPDEIFPIICCAHPWQRG